MSNNPQKGPSIVQQDIVIQSMTQQIQDILKTLKNKPGTLLPILHKIQECLGYIPPQSVPLIAGALKQTPAES